LAQRLRWSDNRFHSISWASGRIRTSLHDRPPSSPLGTWASTTADRRLVLFHPSLSNSRKRLKEWLLHCTLAKNSYRTICSSVRPVFAFADTQILRERNRPFSQLVFGLNINQPGPEALDQSFPHVDIILSPDPLDTNSSRAQQHGRLDSPHWTAPSLPLVPPIFVHAESKTSDGPKRVAFVEHQCSVRQAEKFRHLILSQRLRRKGLRAPQLYLG
jgi:hypothetical protein